MADRYPVGVLKDELGNPVGLREFPEGDTLPKSILPPLDAVDVGLGNVNNTSDSAKPVSVAQQAALDAKVDKVAGKGLSTNDYTTAEKDKLSGVATGATANQTDAYLLNRANHTGVQPISTVTGLQARLNEMAVEAELVQASPSILIVDQLRASVEAASGGKRTVLYNVDGTPSYMNIFTRYELEDLPGAPMGTGPHPAFIRNGVVKDAIMVGSFQACNVGGKAVSQPGMLPWRSINYDNALAACEANGPGWSMVANLEWAAIALWCKANGFEPRGNTMSGKHHINRWETGRGGEPCLSGSGPISWSHDGTPSGIFDLVGNVWEWVTGLKLEDGRVWLAPDNGKNDEADLIDTGYDLTAGTFASRSTEGASDLLRQSLIVPASAALSPVGQIYVTAEGARFPARGGNWLDVGYAGLGALNLNYSRSSTHARLGFRPAFAI